MSDFTANDHLAPSIEGGVPATQPSGANSQVENAKNVIVSSKSTPALKLPNNTTNMAPIDTSAAANAVKNHPLTQSIANGPVAENVKDQSAKTSNEFSNLANARTTPSHSAATGQPLTHYHSFFTTLLSWENPRASGIAFGATVVFIFAARYLDILRYAFKLTWMTLGVTVLAEIAGKSILSTGLTSQFRPKKYFTLSKDTLNSLVGDVHELINFFVIEFQRILFAENVLVSGAAFIASLTSYYLIKVVPFWGLSLIGTSVLFLAPLIYKSNKELIDAQINKAADIANQQSEQVRKLAGEHAARASETTKQYVGDYSAKAQELIGRGRSVSPTLSNKPVKSEPLSIKKENIPTPVKQEAFPTAPKNEFQAPPVGVTANALKSEDEPLIAA